MNPFRMKETLTSTPLPPIQSHYDDWTPNEGAVPYLQPCPLLTDVFPIFSSAPPPSWWVLLNFRLKLGHLLIMEVVSRLVSSAFNNGDWWWDGGLVYLKCHSHKYLRSRSSARIEDHSFEGEGDEVESAVRKEERNGILEDPGDIVVSWPFNLETVYVTDYNYFIRFTMIWWYGGECKGRKRKGGRRTVSFSPSFLLTPPPSTSSSGRQMAWWSHILIHLHPSRHILRFDSVARYVGHWFPSLIPRLLFLLLLLLLENDPKFIAVNWIEFFAWLEHIANWGCINSLLKFISRGWLAGWFSDQSIPGMEHLQNLPPPPFNHRINRSNPWQSSVGVLS